MTRLHFFRLASTCCVLSQQLEERKKFAVTCLHFFRLASTFFFLLQLLSTCLNLKRRKNNLKRRSDNLRKENNNLFRLASIGTLLLFAPFCLYSPFLLLWSTQSHFLRGAFAPFIPSAPSICSATQPRRFSASHNAA